MLSRRTALSLLLVAPAAPAALLPASRRRLRVAIIGAGLAGLTAAHELRRQGCQVTVLEARGRVGGRVYTQRQFAHRQYAEAGGEYIDSLRVHRQLHRYVRDFGLRLASVAPAPAAGLYYLRGQRLPCTDAALAEAFGEDTVDDVDRFWRTLAELAATADRSRWHDISVETWMEQLALSSVAAALTRQYLRGEYDEPERLSMAFLLQQADLYHHVPDQRLEMYRIKGGNDRLPLAMARALGSQLQLNCAVHAVAQTPQDVQIHHTQGATVADYAVVAAPLPPLRQVTFTPELPEAVGVAIATLNYGSHIKVMIQFDQRLWQSYGESGLIITDRPLGFAIEATAQQPGQSGILTAYVSGQAARSLLPLAEAQRVRWVLDQLSELYPDCPARVIGTQVQTWPTDPWVQGSYSSYGPGQFRQWHALRQPWGRVLFAGEHTDAFVGYMEGAVRSGQRAAQQILQGAGGAHVT